MKYEIIGSSSKGNSIIVNNNILLDCGLPYSKIKRHLKDIKLVFISHHHGDHLLPSCIRQLSYNYPNIKFVYNKEDEDITKILIDNGVAKENIYFIKQNKWHDFGICKIKLEELQHDVLNSACKIEIDGKKLIYITDTASVENISAKNYDTYLIEANYHSKEELENRIKEAEERGEYTYLKRVIITHLSEEDAIDWLKNNMADNSEFSFIHQHQEKGINLNENIK